jgi:hypothetical protein
MEAVMKYRSRGGSLLATGTLLAGLMSVPVVIAPHAAVAEATLITPCEPSYDLACNTQGPYDAGAQVYNVKAYGAVGDGSTDDTTAIQNALAAAEQDNSGGVVAGIVFFPPGVYDVSQQLTIATNVVGSGESSSVIHVTTPIGVGAEEPSIVINSSANNTDYGAGLTDIAVTGPLQAIDGMPTSCRMQGNGEGPGCTGGVIGVELTAKLSLRNVSVTGFDTGILLNNAAGHQNLINVTASDNYFGVEVGAPGGDDYILDCHIDHNRKAGLVDGDPATQGRPYFGYSAISGERIENTDLGYQPYSVYQEALEQQAVAPSDPTPQSASEAPWLISDVFLNDSFEHVGNGAFFTQNTNTSPSYPAGLAENISILNPSFSWDSAYKLTGVPADYPLVFGETTGGMQVVEPGPLPFTPGAAGTLYVNNNQAGWDWEGPAPILDVVTGGTSLFRVSVPDPGTRAGSGTIPAGSRSTSIQLGYVGPPDSIFPTLQVTSDGAGPVELVVGPITSSPTGGTTISVTLLGPTPTQALSFNWSLGAPAPISTG